VSIGPLLLGVAAFLVAVLLVPVTSKLAFRFGAVVTPRADRWSRQVVPILGGLAVAIAVGIVAFQALDEGTTLFAWFAGMVGLTAIGLMDDLWDVHPRYRLLAEALIGAGFVIVIFDDLDFWPRILVALAGAIAIPVTANATNLVDNSDGLAGSLSAETALTIALTAMVAGMHGNEVGLALVVAGACLGFLVHNRPPARVFMGDAGSLMLGFALASAGLLLIHDAQIHPSANATAAALAVPLAAFVQFGDVAMVSVTRLRRGVSPFTGGTDHTAHRLRRAGLNPWGMLGVVALASGVCGLLSIMLGWLAPDPMIEIVMVAMAGVIVLSFETIVALIVPFQRTQPADPAVPNGAALSPAEVAASASGASKTTGGMR
jgi:UDP-GlcNAc:undecaprenyl-phosphate GlcNAc-1-phosphate transferase